MPISIDVVPHSLISSYTSNTARYSEPKTVTVIMNDDINFFILFFFLLLTYELSVSCLETIVN